VGCHTIAGISGGVLGPNLTHFGSRKSMAANLMPNTPDNVVKWIENPGHVKPGVLMPDLGMRGEQSKALAAYLLGSLVLNYTPFGRHVLAVGGGEDAARLMGLPVDRTIFLVYVMSGTLSGLAGVILASSYGAGQPIDEGTEHSRHIGRFQWFRRRLVGRRPRRAQRPSRDP